MAAPDIATDEGRREAIAALDPDFQGLMERKCLSQMLQATISNAEITSISRFAAVAEDPADIRTIGVDHLGLNRARDMVKLAGLVGAWQACKVRMKTRHAAEADASLARLPPPVNKVETQDLRIRFEQMFRRMEDKVTPSAGTLEQIFEQVEAGEWKVICGLSLAKAGGRAQDVWPRAGDPASPLH